VLRYHNGQITLLDQTMANEINSLSVRACSIERDAILGKEAGKHKVPPPTSDTTEISGRGTLW
jgi:hypothetical protein